jgi:hypothetical protein
MTRRLIGFGRCTSSARLCLSSDVGGRAGVGSKLALPPVHAIMSPVSL